MSKIAIFSDTHFGINQNSAEQCSEIAKSLDFIISESLKRNVEYIVFLGDLYHSRKELFVPALNLSIEYISKFIKEFKHTYFILGNHDIYFKENPSVHSLRFFDLINSDKLTLISSTTDVTICNTRALMVPWLGSMAGVRNHKYDFMFGHLNIDSTSLKKYYSKLIYHDATDNEISNDLISSYFTENGMIDNLTNSSTEQPAEKSIINDARFSPKTAFGFVKKNGRIYSGHFHNHDVFSRADKTFSYVGSPIELTWGETRSEHGFYVLDTELNSDEFVENSSAVIHLHIDYSDLIKKTNDEFTTFFKDNYNNYIQINFNTPESLAKRQEFITKLNSVANLTKLKLNSNTASLSLETKNFLSNTVTTKFNFIEQYLNSISDKELEDNHVTRSGIIELLRTYYIAAQKL